MIRSLVLEPSPLQRRSRLIRDDACKDDSARSTVFLQTSASAASVACEGVHDPDWALQRSAKQSRISLFDADPALTERAQEEAS
ncbi:MAG: hypothetical protein P8P99_08550 [Maricaulis sp.]|nr:hypothetical protein [Maricaulis sp.]